MPSRLTGQTINLYLKGHCKVLIFQIFFHSHVWHMWVTMYNKIWVIWRWWKKSRMFKNWLNTKWPLRNAMIFSTTPKAPLFWHTWSLAQTMLGFQGFVIFWIFLNLYCPLDWLIKTSVYTSRGHCKIYFFPNFLSWTSLAYVGHRVIEKLGDLEVVGKTTFVQKMA